MLILVLGAIEADEQNSPCLKKPKDQHRTVCFWLHLPCGELKQIFTTVIGNSSRCFQMLTPLCHPASQNLNNILKA